MKETLKSFFSKDTLVKFLNWLKKLVTPQVVSSLIRSLVVKLGFGLTGFQGWIASLFLKKVAKEVSNEAKSVVDSVTDHINEKKYNEVINDPKSTDQEKIKSELDLLNRN